MKYHGLVLFCLFAIGVSCGVGVATPLPGQSQGQSSLNGPEPLGPPDANGQAPAPHNEAPWLHTDGNQVLRPDNTAWAGRGASVHDTRNCDACTFDNPNVAEVQRRIDTVVDGWHADLVRLLLESYPSAGGRVQWQSIMDDPNYLADVVNLVRYVGTKPNTYVEVSLWSDPTLDSNGWPTDQTVAEWTQLAQAFANDSHVIFGIANEPQSNDSGAADPQVWTAMNNAVAAIRKVEDAAGGHHHLIAVQATRDWARYLDYYISHPITAGHNGDNILYETHVYNSADEFERMLVQPSQKLPVLVAEFGPVQQTGVAQMSNDDCTALMDVAQVHHIPAIAWTFHQKCGNVQLLQDSGQGCGVGSPLVASAWGNMVKTWLAKPAQ